MNSYRNEDFAVKSLCTHLGSPLVSPGLAHQI